MTNEKLKGEPLAILLVEDDLDHTELVLRSFKDNLVSNTVYCVGDGEEALDYLFRRKDFADPGKSPRPHMILLDLRLPKIDGLDVLKEIKTAEELRKIPVVILTTSEAESDVARAYDYHANSYLVKPVDFEKFNQLVHDMNYYWLGWNKHPW